MRRILALVVTLAVLAGGGFALWQRQNDRSMMGRSGAKPDAFAKPDAGGKGGEPQRPVPVQLSPVVARDMPVTLEGIGSVQAYYTVTVKSQVDGRLTDVPFAEGQPVKKGELLAQIDPRPFKIQLAQAEAVRARDQAQWKNAKLNLARYQELRKQNLVPTQQVTDQAAQVEQLEAQLRADQAAEDNAKLLLEYCRIVAPIDGVTGVRQVDPGNLVRAADTAGIVVLTQLDPIAVLFTLPEDDLPAIQRGMAAGPLAVEAWSRDGGQRLAEGKLQVVDNQINQATATARLKAVFANPDHALWPNQFVKARLQVAVRAGALVVPAVSVQRGPKGAFVYVVGPEQTAQVRPVEVSALEGDSAIIASGLSAGEQVVTDGHSKLKPGAQVATAGASRAKEGGGGKEDGGKEGSGSHESSGAKDGGKWQK